LGKKRKSRAIRKPPPAAAPGRIRKSAPFGLSKTKTDVKDRQNGDELIFGYHSVSTALRNPDRKFHQIFATPKFAGKLSDQLRDRGIPLNILLPQELDAIVGTQAVHQGIAAKVDPLESLNLEDCQDRSPLIVLDQVTDPHNVGAILRSGAAFGAGGLIMTARNSPAPTGTLAKAASGGLEFVPIVLITNLSRALEELADMGFWRIGLDGDGQIPLEDSVSFRHGESNEMNRAGQIIPRIALVLGAEGKGLRRLTRKNCDEICRLTVTGSLKSLNVSNAAAIALYILQGTGISCKEPAGGNKIIDP